MDKFRLGWWAITRCDQCDTRISVFPWVLLILTFLHVWNVIWWAGLAYFDSSLFYLIFMFVGWVFLELTSLYFMPLVSLRPKAQT